MRNKIHTNFIEKATLKLTLCSLFLPIYTVARSDSSICISASIVKFSLISIK